MDWSFQLYSARNFLPWERMLALLADAGYRAVEGFGGVYGDPEAFRAALDRHGLAMPTGHFALDALEADFDGMRRVADTLGVGLLIAPYLPPEARPADAGGWRAFAARLARVGEAVEKAGYRFAWHNHDFEFRPLADGTMPMELILSEAPSIGWEIDVAWVARGGGDPARWMERHGSRIVAAHVKDVARPGEGGEEDGWSDVGHGTLDWPRLFGTLAAETKCAHYVMEHDNPNDIERFARRSIEAARRW